MSTSEHLLQLIYLSSRMVSSFQSFIVVLKSLLPTLSHIIAISNRCSSEISLLETENKHFCTLYIWCANKIERSNFLFIFYLCVFLSNAKKSQLTIERGLCERNKPNSYRKTPEKFRYTVEPYFHHFMIIQSWLKIY